MKFFKIEYRQFSWEDTGVIVVSANSPAEAIEKAGLLRFRGALAPLLFLHWYTDNYNHYYL